MFPIQPLLQTMRPRQWIKNIFVFAALVFAQELTNMPLVISTVAAFILFCLASSTVYILNDLRDITEDRHHPTKSKRPLASGTLSPITAYAVVFLCITIILFVSTRLFPISFLLVILLYLVMNIAYSLGLKRVVIIDLLIVAIGFVLRAMAGGLAIGVTISPWLLAATFFLALFLILGKRRHELMSLGDQRTKHRHVLGEYSQMMLDSLLIMVTTITMVMYVLYTMAPSTISHFGTDALIYTVVFVVYGIFRAFYLIYQKNQGGAPTEMLLSDTPLQVNILLWVVAVVGIIYRETVWSLFIL